MAHFRFIFVAFLALAGAAAPAVCLAHPAQLVSATVHISRDGQFSVDANFDVLAFALNDTPMAIDDASMNALLDGPREVLERRLAEARERFSRNFVVLCGDPNGQPVEPVHASARQFPTADDVYRWREAHSRATRLPVIGELRLEGRLPVQTRTVSFRFPEVLGPVVVIVERPAREPYSEPVDAGQISSPLPVEFTAASTTQPGEPTTAATITTSELAAAAAAEPAREPGRVHTALKYLALGFHHILPTGPDHMLFVLGLFLLSTRLRPLLWQVTAFTVAHSITLGLALYGVVRAPPHIVEPIIAASIAFVAIENLFTTELKWWRPLVVFAFGLVHGLGFAGALQQTGLPRTQFATALVTFNIGVELGQLAVIALAFAAVGWFRNKPWYRRVIVLPASTAIALVAVFWTLQRVCGAF
jgi:hypothetical protein